MNRRRTILTALAASLLLSACGTTEAPAAAPGAASTAGPVSVTDSRSKEIKLDRPATRVVGLEWGEIEMLVTLGVMPVGAADVKGYGTWVTAARLDAGVKDVGTRGEPSVDSIVALQPDLVVIGADSSSTLVAQLEKFVPVLVTKSSDAADNLARMRADFTMIAIAVGRTPQAVKVLADFDAALAAGRKKIADSGQARQFVVADGWKEGSTVSIRMFGQGALVSQVGIALGLTNAWNGTVDEVWGLGNTDVEGLTSLETADVRFFYNASDGDDVFATGLAANAIWQAMPFVTGKRLHRMPDGIWTFGGPLSCTQYIDALVRAYAG